MKRSQKAGTERGFVLIMMGAAAIALFAVMGLAVDIGRLYIAKSETQAFCDAGALSAATKLDGTSGGINAAQNAVTNSGNAWNWDTSTVSSPTVEFATTPSGPWSSNPTAAAGITYVRVTSNVTMQLYFLPVIVPQYTQGIASRAIAGQVPQASLSKGLAPYSAVSTTADKDPVNFGFVPGTQYSIQWPQYNGTRNGCTPTTPDKCFNSPPCTGDSTASMAAVTSNWGASISGYWGSTSNSVIEQEVLNLIQLQAVTVGQTISMTSGNKSAEGVALDDRVNEDGDNTHDSISAYLGDPSHNGRRLLALPIVNPTPSGTIVVGYGSFFLLSDANGGHPASSFYKNTNGNDPFCAVYVGPYVQGSETQGGSTGGGAFKVLLVQ